VACWLYNRALDYRRKKWRESRETVRYSQQSAMWREWRNEEPAENPLRLLNMSAGQQVLRRLESSYRQFLMGKRDRPRFKKVSRFDSVNYKPGDGASIKNNRLYVQNVGLVRVRWHRELPNGKLKNIIIKRKPSGWYVLLQIELPERPFVRSSNEPIGVDMGILHALALSDGTIIDSPKFLEQSLIKLRVLQRSLARKKKGGNNWRKAKHQIADLHERIANQRLD
jgi:putative transposase